MERNPNLYAAQNPCAIFPFPRLQIGYNCFWLEPCSRPRPGWRSLHQPLASTWIKEKGMEKRKVMERGKGREQRMAELYPVYQIPRSAADQ